MSRRSNDSDRDERDALDGLEKELEELRARHASDPPLDLLRAAHADALPPELQSDVEQFLKGDEWSQKLIEGFPEDARLGPDEEARLLARIKKQAATGQSLSWGWLRASAVAAASIAAIAVVAWYARHPTQPLRETSSQPQTSIAMTTSVRAFQLPLNQPEVKVSLAALTWRGRGDNPLLTDLKAPLDAFRSGDYQQSDRQLGALEGRYSDSVEVFFYRGVSKLFLNDAVGAIAALDRAEQLADSGFAPDVAWYRAVAEQRAGHTADARARLEALCRGTSPRAARACEAMKQLDTTGSSR